MEEETIDEKLQPFIELQETLVDDLRILEKQLKKQDWQVWRRAFCREAFAYIESTIAMMKSFITSEHLTERAEWKKFFITDRKYLKNKKNETSIINSFPSFRDNGCYTIQIFSEVHGSDFKINTRGANWNKLLLASKIRNRTVHPKNPKDINISDAEMVIIEAGIEWFNEQMREIYFQAMKKGLEKLA